MENSRPVNHWLNQCHFGDVRDVLRRMIADDVKVNTIVTSPPYWGLRSYLPADHPDKAREIGSEPTLKEFLSTMVEVFDLCRHVLRDDGTMWVNMGDSYSGGCRGGNPTHESSTLQGSTRSQEASMIKRSTPNDPAFKTKDLIGQPWRLAFALHDAGWYLRQDIIWHKPNPMPESVTDRCTKSHEYLFLLTKNPRYYFDQDAIKEPASYNTHERVSRAAAEHKSAPDEKKNGISPRSDYKTPDGWDTRKGEGGHGSFHSEGREKGEYKFVAAVGRRVAPVQFATKVAEAGRGIKNNTSMDAALAVMPDTRNKRSVWTVVSEPFDGAHFATFPTKLIEPCILAGAPGGGVVLDPFFGSGTTGQVAQQLGRKFIGIELNQAYKDLQDRRLCQPSLELA